MVGFPRITKQKEIPMVSTCCLCNDTAVQVHDLRQCAVCGTGGKKRRCFRNCRFCRTKDFTIPCSEGKTHATCWERHLPLEEYSQEPHSPVDPLQQLYVEAVTYSEPDAKAEAVLHEQDRASQWFAIRRDGEVPWLGVTDRFRQLCNPGVLPNEYSSRQYPGFVSFVGDTGIGKSTLVRAMILMGGINPSGTQYEEDDSQLEERITRLRKTLSKSGYGPVSKSASLSQMTDPTSFGVHLYRDVVMTDHESSKGQRDSFLPRDTPILFADCEGFRAGCAPANPDRVYPKVSQPSLLIDAPITSQSYGKNGKDGIDLFYARFLYAVSDVVVLVMRGDTEFYPTMQRLLEWAASAVYRSVNHLAQKTLVVVRNMAVFHHEDLYDPKILRESLFANLGDLCRGSTLLQRFRNEFNDRRMTSEHKIHSNEDLFVKFFSEIRVCNIPDTGKASSNEVFGQYQYLRQQIVTASQKSQELRSMNWMQYNVPTLSHILNRAFAHFRTSEGPFDFYQAARRDNPDPVSVSDHISNFIRHINSKKDFPQMATSRIIAVNLVVWALRNFDTVLHEPDEIFSRELEAWCTEGIYRYQENDQKCGFHFGPRNPCINRRATHDEHCDETGRRASGCFIEAQNLETQIIPNIRYHFVKQYGQLCTNMRGGFSIPEPEKVRQLRQTVLQEYNTQWKKIFSNKTCFTCLQAVPDHMLNCGHCLCVELALLEHLENAMDLDIPLQEYFDIMIGTSTGGIIALALAILPNDQTGQKDRSVRALKEEFIDLATKTFRTGKEGALVAAIDYFKLTAKAFMALRIWESRYGTKPLREGLKSIFGAENKLFSSRYRAVRVAVTSAKDQGADRCLIANYNRPTATNDSDFEREDEASKEMKIWEAALATSAAPFYFKKFEKTETKKDYTDGALHSNFPVQYTLEEIARIWPMTDGDKIPLDILLSLGTGIQEREIKIPSVLKIGGFEAVVTSFHNNLDCHRKWLEFRALHMADRYLCTKVHRLNTSIEGSYVALDHYKRMRSIDDSIAAQIQDPVFASEITALADILTASLLFFEPIRSPRTGLPSRDRAHLPGSIRCRLARDSNALKNLIDLIDSFWYKEIWNDKERTETNHWTKIPLSDHLRTKIRNQRERLRVPYTISTNESHSTQQVLAVTLRRRSPIKSAVVQCPIPISGFPTGFHSLERKSRTL